MRVIFSLTTSIAQASPARIPKKKPSPTLPHSPPAIHYHLAGLSPPYRNIPAALRRRTCRTFTIPIHRIRFIQTGLSSPTSIAPHLVRRLSPHMCRFTDATVPALHRICFTDPLDRRAEHFIDLPT